MKFEYDHGKSLANRRKHGVSLEEVTAMWSAAHVVVEARVVDETRFMIIGKLGGRIYSCIYTIRGEAIRLISARRSRAKEEKIYHEHISEKEVDGRRV